MSFVDKHPLRPRASADPTAIAKQAINALEQQIFDEFGYRVHMGAELEFVVKAKAGTPNDGNPLGLKPMGNYREHSYTPQSEVDGEKDPLFPDSPYVSHTHQESKKNLPYYQYEAVISHKAFNKPETDDALHMRAAHLVRAIEQTNAILLGNSSGHNAYAWRDKVESTHIDAHIEGINNGLHINVSLTRNGKPQPGMPLGPLCNAIENMGQENIYLLGTDETAATRYKMRNMDKYTMTKFGLHADSYIENAMPSASSNPYYATLLTLAGLYVGLAREQKQTKEAFPSAVQQEGISTRQLPLFSEVLPHAEALSKHPDNSLRAVLNHVQPELGEQFFAAIEQTPPGQETSRNQSAGAAR